MKEVYPGIFSIEQKGILKLLKPPVNIYVITGSDGLIFDAGYGSRSSISQFSKKLQEINRICQERGVENNINRILLSHAHADHFSGLKPLRKKYGFKIILTEQMASIIKSRSAYAKSFSMKKPESSGIFSGIKKLFMGIKSFIEIAVYVRYWGVAFVNDPDIVINQNTNISINNEEWEIFSSPGHADDHITLYNKEKGIFFS
ncbi:MAG: MBL fold metallo-hydrolase, partial [Spirochaetota bacterium]